MSSVSEKTFAKTFALAQINIAEPVDSLDSEQLQGFVSRLEEINGLAEASDGFIWRLKEEGGDATSIASPAYPGLIINMSMWRDIASLRAYVFETAHLEVLKMKSQWFVRRDDTTAAMWWWPSDVSLSPPTVDDAVARLHQLERAGSTPFAFNFAEPWPAPFELTDRDTLVQGEHQFACADQGDLAEIVALVSDSGLVATDLEAGWDAGAYAYFIKLLDNSGRIVATGGLEPRRENAALRSLAVSDAIRGQSVGAALLAVLERLAMQRSLNQLFLLTETAARFFSAHGYLPADRNSAPRQIRQLPQFESLCPDSATCLAKALPATGAKG